MILHGDNTVPDMRFEGLARAAFDNCDKWGDPWGIAAQDFYKNLVPQPNKRGRQGLSKILTKLIIDCNDHELKKMLIQYEKEIWETEDESQIIDIIDYSIAITNKMKANQ